MFWGREQGLDPTGMELVGSSGKKKERKTAQKEPSGIEGGILGRFTEGRTGKLARGLMAVTVLLCSSMAQEASAKKRLPTNETKATKVVPDKEKSPLANVIGRAKWSNGKITRAEIERIKEETRRNKGTIYPPPGSIPPGNPDIPPPPPGSFPPDSNPDGPNSPLPPPPTEDDLFEPRSNQKLGKPLGPSPTGNDLFDRGGGGESVPNLFVIPKPNTPEVPDISGSSEDQPDISGGSHQYDKPTSPENISPQNETPPLPSKRNIPPSPKTPEFPDISGSGGIEREMPDISGEGPSK